MGNKLVKGLENMGRTLVGMNHKRSIFETTVFRKKGGECSANKMAMFETDVLRKRPLSRFQRWKCRIGSFIRK